MFPYRPTLWHQIFPILAILFSAVMTGLFPITPMFIAFGAIVFICIIVSVWIAVSDVLERYTNYWENVGRDIDKLQKSPPELWGALGFTVPPQTVRLQSNVTGEPGQSSDYTMKIFTLNLSPEKMQLIADGLLTGAKSLAESDWAETAVGSSKMREVKHEMLRADLIQLRNPKNKLSGFTLTRKGVVYLWEYSSAWVREQYSLEELLSRVNHTPSEELVVSKL